MNVSFVQAPWAARTPPEERANVHPAIQLIKETIYYCFLAAVISLASSQTAGAGTTIINGADCHGVPNPSPPNPNAPILGVFQNRLLGQWQSGSGVVYITCPFFSVSARSIVTRNPTLAIVDGENLDHAVLCIGSWFSSAISCGAPAPVFLYPPSSLPDYASTAFIWMYARVTQSRPIASVRNVQLFWDEP